MTDTLYCTIDTSRVEEEDKPDAQLGRDWLVVPEQMAPTSGQHDTSLPLAACRVFGAIHAAGKMDSLIGSGRFGGRR